MDFNPGKLYELLVQDLGPQTDELRCFKADSLKKSLLKKYIPKGSDMRLRDAAFENFLAVNDRIKDFVISDRFQASDVFHQWRAVLHKALLSAEHQGPRLTLSGCLDFGKQGPGVVVGGSDTLFFTKMFNSDLTTTSSFLHEFYLHNLSPRWTMAEQFRQREFDVRLVPGSIMSTVRKNADKDRTTCKEPSLNMFYQLGAKAQLEAVLLDQFGIDLSGHKSFSGSVYDRCPQQRLNRALAKLYSRNLDGAKGATLDLKDASDSILVVLCMLLLPRSIFRVLMQIRSPVTKVGRQSVELAMMSTMGNGFTFALMTLLFAALIKAVSQINNLPYQNGLTSCVYGDDLIVPDAICEQVVEALTSSGFQVNTEKSFTTGPFRESCGGDYYNGHDVRGVYIKEFTHEGHCYSAFNRLHLWSIRHGFQLHATLGFLLNLAKFRPVPLDSDVSSGFITTRDEIPNLVLQKSKHLLTRDKKSYTPNTNAIFYEALVPDPDFIGRCEERMLNAAGGLISFLGGYIRDDKMMLRMNNPRLKVKMYSTSSWDWSPLPWLNPRDLSNSWLHVLTSS